MDLHNKKITVIGMGRSGIASANFLAGKKALVTLIDHKERMVLEEAAAQVWAAWVQ